MFSCKVFENFKNTNLEKHLGTAASERLGKISLLLVLGNAVLDGKFIYLFKIYLQLTIKKKKGKNHKI